MSRFIVSARKYRPATFESVIGQSHITSTLQNAISRGQLAHAYLFCGPRGVGKTTCARIVAKTINCMNRTASNEACNECESCMAFDQGSSFNIHELDAASNTSVDNIRSLNEQVRILPQIGRYSVYIIDEVHMLSTSAFNAFLKTLEEPPAHVIFILATTEKHKILPTILSRCQIYDFKRITIEDVVRYLQHISSNESVKYDDESLHMIAAKADGCMRDALSMYDKVVSFCGADLHSEDVSMALNILDYDTYFSVVSMLNSGDYGSALLKYDDILQRGFDTQTFVSGLANHLRNVLVARNGNTVKLLEITGNVASRYQQQSKELTLPFLFGTLDLLASLEGALKSSLNQRLTCEIALLKISNISGAVYQPQPPTKAQLAIQSQVQQQPIGVATSSAAPVQTPKSETMKVAHPIPEVTQQPTATPPPARRSMGIPSIKSIREGLSEPMPQHDTVHVKEEYFEEIDTHNTQKVLDACIEYSAKIAETKTRISIVLKDSKIEAGKIKITVPSQILQEEIIKQKHELLSGIKEICGIGGLDFEIVIDDSVDPSSEKRLYIKSEDKLEYLNSQNKHLAGFIKELNLHIV